MREVAVLKRAAARSELLLKIAELTAFEATPAGAALKKYRSAMQVAVMADEDETPDWLRRKSWDDVRTADQELMAEIKRLQEPPRIELKGGGSP